MKLLLVAPLAVLMALPVQAALPAYQKDRLKALGGIGASVCAFHRGLMTKEQSNQMANAFLRRNPGLGPAANWAVDTKDGENAMRITLKYLDPGCKSFREGSSNAYFKEIMRYVDK
ncbi:MAG: hypothetical protein CMJ60_11785 [Planctomycetaceae bacterium]|nr:hypothetical protein [Planctomycetaceae bacterium]